MPTEIARLSNISADIASPLAEDALAAFTEFLNYHHELNDEDHRVDRAHYASTPIIILAYAMLPDPNDINDSPITLQIIADPYGDEGGPSFLTAFFDPLMGPDFPPGHRLRHLIQEFDTERNMIIRNGEADYNIPA